MKKPQTGRKTKFIRSVPAALLQVGMGFGAALLVAAFAAVAWVAINGLELAPKLIELEPLLSLVFIDFVVYCLLTASLVAVWRATQTRQLRVGAYTLAVLTLAAVGAAGFVHYSFNKSILPGAFSPEHTDFVVDQRIKDLASEAGIDTERLKRGQPVVGRPAETGSTCDEVDVVGCFDGKIYIYPEALAEIREEQRSTVAHEYLHWHWSVLPAAERQRLTPYLNIVYGQYKAWFDERTATIQSPETAPGSETFTDELHSFIGTEVDRSMLPPELRDWYEIWVPNDDKLPKLLTP